MSPPSGGIYKVIFNKRTWGRPSLSRIPRIPSLIVLGLPSVGSTANFEESTLRKLPTDAGAVLTASLDEKDTSRHRSPERSKV